MDRLLERFGPVIESSLRQSIVAIQHSVFKQILIQVEEFSFPRTNLRQNLEKYDLFHLSVGGNFLISSKVGFWECQRSNTQIGSLLSFQPFQINN